MFQVRCLTAAFAAVVLTAVSMPIVATDVAAKRSNASSSSSCLPGILKRRLSQIRSRFGPVRVISTFRRGARIAGSGKPSYHASCRAVDFLPPRGKYRAVANWLKQNHFGGVGTYSCGMYHIHIDNGPRVRFHKCGRRSSVRYAKRKRSRSRKAIYRNRKRRASNRRSARRSIRRTARASAPRRSRVARKSRRYSPSFENDRYSLGTR